MSVANVSIIIPVFNKWELTRSCIESIYRTTPPSLFEIIVMDNGSTDLTNLVPDVFPSITYLKENHSVGFARANNLAARHAHGSMLCLLNNDTIVTKNWLEPLVAACAADQSIAAVGPKLLFPDGRVQAAGIVFSYTRLPYHYGRFLDHDHPAVNIPAEFNSLTGACILCKKNRYLEDGGFDEQFVNGFEDIDMCLRWRKKGYTIRYEPRSVVTHMETQTERVADNHRENARMYAKKWTNAVIQDDLNCYARMRLAHPHFNMLGVVIRSDGATERLHKAIRCAFCFSKSSISVLVLLDESESPETMSLQKSTVLDYAGKNDQPAISGWINAVATQPRFKGIVHMKRPCAFPQFWDSSLEPYFEKIDKVWLVEPDMFFQSYRSNCLQIDN